MELLKLLENCDWQEFEKLVSEILRVHDYAVHHNTNLTINKIRRQFDIIAHKKNYSLVVDCKKWRNKKTRVNALMKAAEKHAERCSFLGKIFDKKIMPAIITYAEEPIMNHCGVFIVPLNKLNDFILGLP
ncbi:MAG: restriction endonuclease [Candidatus Nanoarchaeia archaeon]|nr:restriction endonuclease [Candidatus Nanoarchaeia archaeon]